MKRTIFAFVTVLIVFVAVFGVLVLRPVPKVKAHHHGCSNATLWGNYGLVGSGWYLFGLATPALLAGPANASAVITFDGKGGFSGYNLYVVVAGTVIPGGPFTFSNETYTVNTDCTFSATFTESDIFEGSAIINGTVVDNEGNQIIGNLLSSGTTATWEAKRVPGEEMPTLDAVF